MKIVKTLKTTLLAPFSSSDASLTVAKFVDLDGNEVALSDFGSWGVVVIKQGTTVEIVKFSGVTQSASDTSCVLTVASSGRSIAGTSPYAGASTGEDFNSGAEVIVTNDPLTLSRFGNLDVAATWDAIQTFSVLPRVTAGDPMDDNDLARKAYVDNAVGGSYPANRIVVTGTAGETLVAGNLVYLKTSDGQWWKCDADTAATVENVLLGIAQGAGSAGVAVTSGVLIRGYDNNQTGLTANAIAYAGNTAGAIVSTTPGTVEVTVGFSLSTTAIYFSPGFNQQITEDQQDALAGSSGTPSASNKYITADDVSSAGVSGKIVRLNGTAYPAGDGTALTGVALRRFGGTGADGALSITSGTTNIDLGGAAVVVKNYTTISITGTGKLTFTNAHANGTKIILKATGNVTLTSSEAPMIDASGLGGDGAAGQATGSAAGSTGTNGLGYDLVTNAGGGGQASGAGGGTAGAAITTISYQAFSIFLERYRKAFVGAGGGSGGTSTGTGTSGVGGKGGGCLIIECAGAWNFTTASGISVAGAVGGNASGSGGGDRRAGGGGGGGGFFLAIYNTLTANTGTITVSGGVGGNNSSGTDSAVSGGGGGSSDVAGNAGTTSAVASAKTGGDGGVGKSSVVANTEYA